MRSSMIHALLALGANAMPSASVACASCAATAAWPGWAGIKHAFIFGDSYTQTGFDTTLTPPSPSNPLGNPPYPGWTSSNGPNWVDFLTVKHNASLLLTYNLAYGGATVDSALVEPWKPTVLSLKDQVSTLFVDAYASRTNPVWTGSDSVFAIWIGINDVGNSYWNGAEKTTILNGKIMEVYRSLVGRLYESGARNFVLLNVPAVERSPLTLGQGTQAIDLEGKDIAQFNSMVADLAAALKREKGEANVWVYDSYAAFAQVLDDPKSWPQTAGYRNVTGYCEAYQNGTPQWNTSDPSCAYPVDQYFWLNSLHPTYPVHDVVAEGVARLLKAGPNVCPQKKRR